MTDSTAEPTCPSIAGWEEYNKVAVPMTIASKMVTPTGMFDASSGGDAMVTGPPWLYQHQCESGALPCVIMLTRIAARSRDHVDEGPLDAGILQQIP